jgi:hypothetical protein
MDLELGLVEKEDEEIEEGLAYQENKGFPLVVR